MSNHLPRGFRFAGTSCGIKHSKSKDLCLIVSDLPAAAAGVYTRNQVVAAPVLACRKRTPSSDARAVVVNSGNANACTGDRGIADAERMCQQVAEIAGFSSHQTLVMSTGVIGHFLPMDKIETGIRRVWEELSESEISFLDAADAIRTTDKYRKVASRSAQLGPAVVRLAGMAKGAGMIGPNMATMLCCIITDARLTDQQAQRLLQSAADLSFNNISVEGHTSTNDTMLLLANGAASESPLTDEEEMLFGKELNAMCVELAKQIPADGEGATHVIEIHVRGALSDADARTVARAVANSNLVKTAVFGNDPNWGRIVSAAGYAGPSIDVQRLGLKLNGIQLFQAGEPVAFEPQEASRSIRDNPTTVIELSLGEGPGSCTHWTSDLTVDYVRFNSEYTT